VRGHYCALFQLRKVMYTEALLKISVLESSINGQAILSLMSLGDPMFINAAKELANDYLVDHNARIVKLSSTISVDVFFKFENETIDLQSAIDGDVFPVTLGNYKQYSIQHGYFFFVPFLIKHEDSEVTTRPIGIHRRSLNAFELKCIVSQHVYKLLDGFGIIEEIKAGIAYELLATSFLP